MITTCIVFEQLYQKQITYIASMSTVSVGAEAKEASRNLNEGSRTITEDSVPSLTPPPTLKLRLKKDGKEKKKVVWSTETVDNEHLGKFRNYID